MARHLRLRPLPLEGKLAAEARLFEVIGRASGRPRPTTRRSEPAMTGAKLIIQIPCFNEAANLGITLASLPRAVPGFACVDG